MRPWWVLCLLLAPAAMAAVSPQQTIQAPGGAGFGGRIEVVGDHAILEAAEYNAGLGGSSRPYGAWLFERSGTQWSRAVDYTPCDDRPVWEDWALSFTHLIQAVPCGEGRPPEDLVETGVDQVDPVNHGHVKRWQLAPARSLPDVTYGTGDDRLWFAEDLAAGDGWWATTWETSELLRIAQADGTFTEEEVTYEHVGIFLGDETEATWTETSGPYRGTSAPYILSTLEGILRIAGGDGPTRSFTVGLQGPVAATWPGEPSPHGRDGQRATLSGRDVTVYSWDGSWQETGSFQVEHELSPYGSIDVQGDVLALGLRGITGQECTSGGLGNSCTAVVEEPGHALVYHRAQNGSWLLHEDVIGPREVGDLFGAEVAVADMQVWIGAPGTDPENGRWGRAYVRTLNGWPTAGYTWSHDPTPFTFDRVTFTSTSTDPEHQSLKHTWDFDGDGETDAEGAQVAWSWSRAGIHPVTLTVEDTQEGRNAITHAVTVRNRPPMADFYATPTPVWRTADTVFENHSWDLDGNITTCAWDFGDGRTSDACEPTLAYPKRGQYAVTMDVCDDGDGQDPPNHVLCTRKERVIDVFNHPPIIEYTLEEDPISLEPFTVGVHVSDPDGTIVSHGWRDEGQGDRTFTPRVAGHLRLGYIATDDEGDTTTAWLDVDVRNRAPTAALSLPAGNATRTDLAFADGSTDPDGRVATWAWDFGDGTTSTDRNPRHAYQTQGTYNVSLQVWDQLGAASSVAQATLVIDNEAPTARIGAAVSDGVVTITDDSFDPDGKLEQRIWTYRGEETHPSLPWSFPLPDQAARLDLEVVDDRGARHNTSILLGAVPDRIIPVLATEATDPEVPLDPDDPETAPADPMPQSAPEASLPPGDSGAATWLVAIGLSLCLGIGTAGWFAWRRADSKT